MPYHSITSHFPEWFRIVPLRSLNAENQERVFKDVKQSTKTTNFNHDHLMINALLRSAVKILQGKLAKNFGNQESTISKEWKGIPSRPATVITQRMIDEDPAAFALHKKRISDFLLDGNWHTVLEDGSWVFKDGESDICNSTMKPMHFRYNTQAVII